MHPFLLNFLAQATPPESLWTEPGVLITILLVAIPVLVGLWLFVAQIKSGERRQKIKEVSDAARETSSGIVTAKGDGLLSNVDQAGTIRFLPTKKRTARYPGVHPPEARLILWYLGAATFWLLFGTTVGEYIGIKFVTPDIEQISWLSFGRLRPVHTNAVFWGWASLAMLGLGYYVVALVGNVRLACTRAGWWTFWLVNASVVLGSITLMAGINNGGGEYREYVWPIMLLFAVGIIIALWNFIATVARRRTEEIYISNWYMVAAIMFLITITIVAYVPFWQNGLGETIVQGYYMHQGVGMWFMMFLLGLVYYFLPQQLNTPIFSYSLGVLAFWTQILFYTVIGTHHFVFSAIPWSLQTVGIVGSVGMVIPVAAGTTNFLLTFKGSFKKVAGSYTLPFLLVGVVFYFTGSMQGTAEAFRSTNLLWHFTDFTVAHSHLTMYGIITFLLWGCIYATVPRLTGREPPHGTVGAHFWLALVGLMFYSVPLMIGGTMRGIAWIDQLPFIDSVILMAPYWLWRAIGGTLMWVSHFVFAYNMWHMMTGEKQEEVADLPADINEPGGSGHSELGTSGATS